MAPGVKKKKKITAVVAQTSDPSLTQTHKPGLFNQSLVTGTQKSAETREGRGC